MAMVQHSFSHFTVYCIACTEEQNTRDGSGQDDGDDHLPCRYLVACVVDLQPGNIVFAVSASDIDEALKDSTPTLAKVKWLDGAEPDNSAQEYLVVPEPIYSRSVLDCRFGDIEAKITDFGVARWPNRSPLQRAAVPLALRAPEILYGQTSVSTFKTDIWNLACLVFELVSGEPLFCLVTFGLSTAQINKQHRRMIQAIIQPTQSQEGATIQFTGYLGERTKGRLGDDDVRMLARMLRQSMLLIQPCDQYSLRKQIYDINTSKTEKAENRKLGIQCIQAPKS